MVPNKDIAPMSTPVRPTTQPAAEMSPLSFMPVWSPTQAAAPLSVVESRPNPTPAVLICAPVSPRLLI